jgi:hypothetical protein
MSAKGYESSAFRPANSIRDFRELLENPDAKVIRTMEDWKAYLGSEECALRDLPRDLQEKFTESLVLNNGLAAFQYDEIENRLTFRQFRSLLNRFGMDLGVFVDYDGYYCESKGTCTKRIGSICIGDNC